MLDYKLPYHVIQEDDDYLYEPKLSFISFEEAKEFVQFAHSPNLIIVETEDLKDFFFD